MIKRLLSALFAVLLTLGAATAFAAADVNKASQAELEAIKGIGPSIAGKILDERKKSNFKDWPDLVGRVKGVGDANAAKFSTAGLTVNGQGFAGAAAPAAKPAKAEMSAAKAATKADAASAAAVPAAKADKAAAKTAAASASAPMSKAAADDKATKAAKADAAASAAKK